jgi:hypothetical protein
MGLKGLGLCLLWTGATGQKSTDSALAANEKCGVTKSSQAPADEDLFTIPANPDSAP